MPTKRIKRKPKRTKVVAPVVVAPKETPIKPLLNPDTLQPYGRVLPFLVAVDPGVSGGIAWRNRIGETFAMKMPDTEGEIINVLETIETDLPQNERPTCVIEKVGGYIGKIQPGSAMFTFGFNTGFIRGAMMSRGWRIETVLPASWQKWYSLGTARQCESKAEWKRKLKGEAERRFPKIKVTLSTSDALLILDWRARA